MPRASSGLTAVLLIAAAVRIAACVLWSDDLTRDRDVYLGIAHQVASGVGFCTPGTTAPTAYRPPVYPLLLAAVLLVAPSPLAVATVNIVAGLVTVAATYGLALRCGLTAVCALIAAAAVALDPLLIRYTAQPMTECTFTAFVAVLVWLLVREQPQSLGTGVVGGLAALCRPTLWPFLFVVMVVKLLPARWSDVRFAAGFIVGTLLTVAPWVVRNQVRFGVPVLTTTHGGYTLLLANNAEFFAIARQPWGATWDGERLAGWQRTMLADAERELGPNAGEVGTDRWQAREARRQIAADPRGFAAAVWYRIRSLWSLVPRGEGQPAGLVRWLVAVWYSVLFVLSALGTGWALRDRLTRAVWLLVLIASVQAVHLVYWTDTRMRAPLHPALAVLAGLALQRGFAARPSPSVELEPSR